MPRDIPVGNGRLLVCFDRDYAIRDLYFPHVGQENHLGGGHCRMGVWVEGQFSWVGPEWKHELAYQEDTLVTRVDLYHPGLELLLSCRDTVDFHENVYLRCIEVENLAPRPREVRLFFSHDLNISGNSIGDTATYDPESGGVLHYKGARYFLANACGSGGAGVAQFATGQKGIGGKEGTFRDAEDGELSGNPIAQGSVDSVIALHLQVDGLAKQGAGYWIAAGNSWGEVRRLDAAVRNKTPEHLVKRTADYWALWLKKEAPPLDRLPDKVAALYRRSLLVLITQIDADGGILAANDSDVVQFNRDTYSYVWPRDGALVANALDLAGYYSLSQGFYRFVSRVIGRQGYLLHKYNPDGTPASSWHPWFADGEAQLPIQEDETALVLWALWNHFVLTRDVEFVKPLYRPLIKAAADFLCDYRDAATGLPGPSYDLWEERRGILGFTVGTVFGGLTAASLFCTVFGEEDLAERYRAAAAALRDAASTHLWRPDLNRFCRMLSRKAGGELQVDGTLDASLWGLFAFGLYAPDDPRIVATMDAVRERLWVRTEVGGLARYEADPYYRVSDTVPGNPWFICTLWLADYLVQKAGSAEELDEARTVLEWVADHALPSGVLPEQVHPLSGEPLSVSPLTWSHATFVGSVQRLLRRLGKLDRCPECGQPRTGRGRGEDWIQSLYAQACDAIHGACRVN